MRESNRAGSRVLKRNPGLSEAVGVSFQSLDRRRRWPLTFFLRFRLVIMRIENRAKLFVTLFACQVNYK